MFTIVIAVEIMVNIHYLLFHPSIFMISNIVATLMILMK